MPQAIGRLRCADKGDDLSTVGPPVLPKLAMLGMRGSGTFVRPISK
jgi:hypothetical protein